MITEFAKALRISDSTTVQVISPERATRMGLVTLVNGSGVDGVVRVGGYVRTIELLGYAPPQDRGDVIQRDGDFRSGARKILSSMMQTCECTIYFTYKDQMRANRGIVQSVPRTQDFMAIYKELKSIFVSHISGNQFDVITIRLFEDSKVKSYITRRGEIFLSSGHYPVCAQYFSSVRLSRRQYGALEVKSSLNSGFIGLDKEWLATHLAQKIRGSQTLYRSRSRSLPVWLVIHVDSTGTHRTIPHTQIADAVDLSRHLLLSQCHGFQRVYLATNTCYFNATQVYTVFKSDAV